MTIGRTFRRLLRSFAWIVPQAERADWISEWTAGVTDDIRFAVRSLRQTPAFSATVVVTLALGVGLISGILAFADGYLFRPLPFPGADRAYYVRDAGNQTTGMVSATDARLLRESPIGQYGFVDWSVSSSLRELDIDGVRVPAFAYEVSPGFRRTLELPLGLGRDFAPDDHREGAPLVGWLSHRFWQGTFGGDARVLDRVIPATGPRGSIEIRIVGILAPEVTTLDSANEPPDMVVPARGLPREGPNRYAFPLVLLPPDVSVTQATERMSAILQAGAPAADGRPRTVRLTSFDRVQRGGGAPTARILFTGAMLVMLLAAMNLLHLLLGRGETRLTDVATRVALGATRWRVTRGLLVESLVLGGLGIGLGLVAGKGMSLLIASRIPGLPTKGRNLSMMPVLFDERVMLIAAAFGLVAAIAGGLWPARRAWRASLDARVRNPIRRTARLARVILASELTVVTIVSAGAIYAGTGIYRYLNKPLGFELTDRIQIDLLSKTSRVSPEDIAMALDAVSTTGGVQAVAGETITVPGQEQVEVPGVALDTKRLSPQGVAPGLFEAWGWKLVEGRWFDRAEFDRSDAVVVNEQLARLAWPRGGAVGATIRTGPQSRTVVGVIAAHQWRLDMPLRPELFVPAPARSGRLPLVAWAPATPAEDIQARLTAAIETAVPGVTAYVRPLTFETYFARGIGEARFQGPIVTAFAILAGILAVVGVFGIVSFLVSQRTREFGIRLALGATRRNIQAAVIRESLLPAAGGVIAGSIGAWALARVVRSAVFEWDTSGGVAIAIVVVGLLLVATVAAFAPAVRASRVDPATSLRE
jgi:predicted permease